MLTFRLLFVTFLSTLASIVVSLPVAEDTWIANSALDDLPSDSSFVRPVSRSISDPLTRKVDEETPSSEPNPEDRGSSIVSALRLSPTGEEEKTGLKRDDIRKYDKPRPWAYEDYRAIYLAGLARIASEGGEKIKEKRYPSGLELDSLLSMARSAEKRDSEKNTGAPTPKDGNDSIMLTDNWGLTSEDYRRFYEHNLSEGYPQWSLEEWQNFMNRYLEFVASGGQVGKGGRKRGDLWNYNSLHNAQSRYSFRDWQILKLWLGQNDHDKRRKLYQRNGHQKRDRVDQYHSSMHDEDGRGGLEGESITRWETISDLEIWASMHGHSAKQKRSQDLKVVQESLDIVGSAAVTEIQDQLPHQSPLPAQQASIPPAADGSSVDGGSLRQDKKTFWDKTISLLNQGMRYLYCSSLGPIKKLGLGNKKLVRKQDWGSFMRRSYYKRDDIRKYGTGLTDPEWSRLWAPSTATEANRLLEEAEKPKVKREAGGQYEKSIDFENLTVKDKKELYGVAMSDPAFLEFQRQYLAQKVRKRLPLPPRTHQTAPIHKGSPPTATDNDALDNESPSSDSTIGATSSSQYPPSKAKIRNLQKRADSGRDEDFNNEEEETLNKINGERVVEPPEPVLLERKGLQQHVRAESEPVPDFADGRTIAEVIAAEEASNLPEEDSDQEKRDNMHRYGSNLDDYDDYVLSSLFCDTEECLLEASEETGLTQKRDSMDKHESRPEDWEDYSDLLEAMKDGRVPSFYPRVHPRDLSNFPSWIPSENPAPPQIRPAAASKKGKRDNRIRQSGLSNFPSWAPSENPAPPKIAEGVASSKKAKRDKVDQYDRSMIDEDEWIDIYRLYYVQRQRTRQQSQNVNGKRNSRRVPQPEAQPEPAPEPDTVVVRPKSTGLTQIAKPTTVKDAGVSSITSLLSLIGASPGPGVSRTQSPAAALSPASPSDIFFPFGPLLPLGPSRPNVASDRKRREAGADALADRDDIDRRRTKQYTSNAAGMPPIERRIPTPTPTLSISGTTTESASLESQTQSASPTKVQYPEGAAPPPDFATSIGDVIRAFGPLLDVASALPAASNTSRLPSAGSINGTNSTSSTKAKRDSITHYDPNTSIQDFTDDEWDTLDNYITFQEAEEPVKRQALSSCLEYDANPSQDILEPGCLCRGSTKALPILEGPDPCAYTSVPKTRIRRDDMNKYISDKDGHGTTYVWVPTGRIRTDGDGLKERKESLLSRDTQTTGGETLAQHQQQQQQQEGQQEEAEQQQEGAEQAKMEQGGGRRRLKAKQKNRRQSSWQWVPEEDELTEGMPEGSKHDKKKEKRVRLPNTTEGEEIKRHCGGRSDLPEGGYGSNETAALCG